MTVRQAAGRSPEGAAPGLALYHQTSEPESAREGCPNRVGMVLLDYESGVWRPARCGRLACPYCVAVEALLRAGAIWLARPRRAIRVSLVADAGDPDPWPTARRRMNRTREEYRRRTRRSLGDWCYSVEPNPRGTGFHAHAWQHGPDKVDMAALDVAAQAAGAGFCKVETVRNVGQASRYGLKGLGGAGYGLKGTDGDPAEYLRVNGGRLTHQSRGFFRSEDGATLPVRQAESAALAALYGEREPGRWGLVTEAAARSWASLMAGPGLVSATRSPGACSPAARTA